MFLPLLGLTVTLSSDLAKGNLSESTLAFLKSSAMILGGSLITLLGTFLLLMKNEYRHTFFSNESALQMTKRLFLEGNDLERHTIFTVTRTYWKSFEDKAAMWVKEGWASWEDEKPDWFTDQWKANVPEYMKPTKRAGEYSRLSNSMRAELGKETQLEGGEMKVEKEGRRKSIVELISAHKTPKISPAGATANEEIDAAEFVREMKRRGSISM